MSEFKEPVTPVRGQKVQQTPRVRKTVLNSFDQSYIEEDDATYVYGSDGSDSEDSEILDEVLEEDETGDEDNSTEVESDLVDEKEAPVAAMVPEISVGVSNEMGKLGQFLMKHEVLRKALHSSIGFVVIYLYTLGVHQTQLLVPLSGLFVAIITNDYIRLHNPDFNRFIVSKFYYLLRDSEVHKYNGILYYLAGLILVFLYLPKDISMMSAFLLSWADTAASTFGRKFGKYTFQISKGKSAAGALASFVTGVFSCYLTYGYLLPAYSHLNAVEDIEWTAATSRLNLHVYALLSGAVASFSEFVDLYGVDDNFTIPVISGYLLYGVVRLCKV